MQLWLNGRFQAADEARVGATSAGLMLGWGVFTTIGVWRRRPFALDRHLARLRRDAARAHVPFDVDDIILANALLQLIENHYDRATPMRNEAFDDELPSDGVARITAARRGDGRWNEAGGSDVCVMFRPHNRDTSAAEKDAASRFEIAGSIAEQAARRLETDKREISTHVAASSTEQREHGPSQAQFQQLNAASTANVPLVRLAMSPYRVEARRALCGVKSTSYGDYDCAWREAKARGFDEAIVRNNRGALCEGAHSSVFWARGDELRTPALGCGCLPGIARELVLEWAWQDQIPVCQSTYAPRELDAADEIFITSAAQGPRAVGQWHNGNTLRFLAAPGPLAAYFLRRWNEAVSRD